MKKPLCALFVLATITLCCFAALPMEAQAATVVASGSCGYDVTWTLDDEGTMTISGTDFFNHAPTWHRYKSRIKTVIIQDGLTDLPMHAFSEHSALTSVTIPDSVSLINEGAFQNCSSLTSITIPNRVTKIKGWTFAGCSSLTSITIPNSVSEIEKEAFQGCSSLTSVTIPDSVTEIDGGAFSHCTSLTSVTIPDSVATIECLAFAGCSSLISVTIPDSITEIQDYAFDDCTSLWHVLYKGTESQWNDIEIGINRELLALTRHYNCTGNEITDLANKVCSVCLNCTHTWDNGEVTKQPTCTEAGEKLFTCSNCKTTKTEPIAATGHAYGDWIQVTAPTTEAAGLEERACACGQKEQREVAKLSSTPDENDNSSVMTIVIAAVIGGAVGGSAAVFLLKKKK